jgi:cytochrome c peroxidase
LGKQTFTAIEQEGYELFQQNCNSCHTAPLFTDYSFRNNGLTNDFTSDNGREHITLDPADRGKFKVPSLRNVQISYPYMHDGRLDNLSEVIDHYSEGIVASPTLDPSLSNMNFTAEEKAALIAFLYTLNDYSFLGNHAISEP